MKHERGTILCVGDETRTSSAMRCAFPARAVDHASRVSAFCARVRERRYTAWVVDDAVGIEALAWGRGRADDTPALLVAAHFDRHTSNRAQRLGAELLFEPYGSAHVAAFLARADARHAPIADVVAAFARRHALPARELDLVDALHRGVSRRGLAAELGVSENTIKTMVRVLLERTHHESVDDVVRTLLRAGEHARARGGALRLVARAS